MAKRRTYRRPWHRTADSVLHEDWPLEIVGMFTLLQAAMHERWRTGGLDMNEAATIHLNRAALAAITKRAQFRHGVSALSALAEFITCSVRVQGESVVLSWPKWPEFQGLVPILDADGSNTAPSPAPSPESAPEVTTQVAHATGAESGDSGSDPDPPNPPTPTEQARAVWPRLREAVAKHGKAWDVTASPSRIRLIAARIRDDKLAPDDLVAVIGGALAYWRDNAPADFEAGKRLVPETLFAASNWPKYLEAARAGPAPGKPQSLEERRAAHARKMREQGLWPEGETGT